MFIKKYGKFMKKLVESELLEPWSFKMQISYFISIFKGYEQHDANDLIIYLINTLNDFSKKDSEESNYS